MKEKNKNITKYSIHTLYRNFFTFLNNKGENPWSDYCKYYIETDEEFFSSYFQCFTYSPKMLKERVRKTEYSHYSYTDTLTKRNPPERIVEKIIRKCISIAPVSQKLNAYIIIGFFSADGFTIKVRGKPVIGIGLERMHDFSNLDIITAHEYAHFLRICYGFKSENLLERTVNEGIATHFSQIVLPEKTLPKHLFLTNAEFNRLLLKKNEILYAFHQAEGTGFYEIMKEKTRVKNFLGYFIIKEYLDSRKTWTINDILRIRSLSFKQKKFNRNSPL